MRKRYEPVDEDEEVVEEEEELAGEEEELAGSEEEIVEEEEEVVGKPKGDPVLEYAYGLAGRPPDIRSWRFADLVAELRRADALGRKGEAKRWADLVYAFCPLKPRACPVYSLSVSRCRYGLEKRCRARAFAKRR